MADNNVHETEPTDRDDLKHTDTVATEETEDPGAVGAEQDPFDLDRDIAEDGELVHDSPINEPLGRMPGA